MTVRELIDELLRCNSNDRVALADDADIVVRRHLWVRQGKPVISTVVITDDPDS